MNSKIGNTLVLSDETLETYKDFGESFKATFADSMMNWSEDSPEEKQRYEKESERAREIWERMREAVTPEELELFEQHYEVR